MVRPLTSTLFSNSPSFDLALINSALSKVITFSLSWSYTNCTVLPDNSATASAFAFSAALAVVASACKSFCNWVSALPRASTSSANAESISDNLPLMVVASPLDMGTVSAYTLKLPVSAFEPSYVNASTPLYLIVNALGLGRTVGISSLSALSSSAASTPLIFTPFSLTDKYASLDGSTFTENTLPCKSRPLPLT